MRKRTISLAAVLFCFALAGSATAATYSFDYPDVPLAITEGDWVYADLTIGGDLGAITDINVFVDIEHTWMADLDIYVAHQEQGGSSWKWVQLYNQDGDSRDNMTSVLFDDQAAASISGAVAPYGPGSFRPTSLPEAGESNLLSDYNGDQAAGIWSLVLFDNFSGDTGEVHQFRIEFETQQNPVPLPGAIVLFGSGLGAVAGLRRLRQK